MNILSNLDVKKKLFINMFIAQAMLFITAFAAYKIGYNYIYNTVEKDINIVANTLEKELNYIASIKPDAIKDPEFKNKITDLKIGDSGYVYIINAEGRLVVHPTSEGRSLKNKSYIQHILNNKSGIYSYQSSTTNQDKTIAFRYIPAWDVWVVPGVNDEEYFDEFNSIFLASQIIIQLILMIILSATEFFIAKSILNPVKKLEEFMQEFLEFISWKRNRIEIPECKYNDEIGKVLQGLGTTARIIDSRLKEEMKVMGEVVLTMDKISDGHYNCRVVSDTSNPQIKTLKLSLNKMLERVEHNIQELVSTLSEFTNDDFRRRISNEHIHGDMRKIIDGVNELGLALGKGASDNLVHGTRLEESADIMKKSVITLSTSSNEQAASLEETAASIEEITSNIKSTVDKASEMNAIASELQDSSKNGNTLATSTASAMEDINESTTAINDAISVIDQIAFQTNILSLNAAVEAATAGEAGKGFAVVAQEVRALAARSAEAANEIKALVEQAQAKAEDGKSIADSMMSGYEELSSKIEQTRTLIQDVTDASREQMDGMDQINDAVMKLDQMTQENAAIANEVSTASSGVSSLANQMANDARGKEFDGKVI